MKNYITLILAFCVLSMFTECKKSTNTINISGYTATDLSGNIISNDTADWKASASVPSQIISTLNALPLTVSGLTNGSNFCGTLTLYPNPCTSVCTLHIANTCLNTYCFKFVIVDKYLQVYTNNSVSCILNSNTLLVNVSGMSSGLYRMYYGFYDETNALISAAYGDIQVN